MLGVSIKKLKYTHCLAEDFAEELKYTHCLAEDFAEELKYTHCLAEDFAEELKYTHCFALSVINWAVFLSVSWLWFVRPIPIGSCS